MARLARSVFPGVPHHVTQRGNGRQQVFFCDDDYALYRDLLAGQCQLMSIVVWAWALTPNHVHLILEPSDSDGKSRALARVHRDYAGHIHARDHKTGHFWQGRFGCVAMDEAHAVAALRYVALNPVRARLVKRADDWRWSSVHVHLGRTASDGLTDPRPAASRIEDMAALLAQEPDDDTRITALRRGESIGRPVGDDAFFDRLESLSGRSFRPAKRGPKPVRN